MCYDRSRAPIIIAHQSHITSYSIISYEDLFNKKYIDIINLLYGAINVDLKLFDLKVDIYETKLYNPNNKIDSFSKNFNCTRSYYWPIKFIDNYVIFVTIFDIHLLKDDFTNLLYNFNIVSNDLFAELFALSEFNRLNSKKLMHKDDSLFLDQLLCSLYVLTVLLEPACYVYLDYPYLYRRRLDIKEVYNTSCLEFKILN